MPPGLEFERSHDVITLNHAVITGPHHQPDPFTRRATTHHDSHISSPQASQTGDQMSFPGFTPSKLGV